MSEPKNCQINIWNQLGWALDDGMMQAVLTRMAMTAKNAAQIEIYPQERVPEDAPTWKHPGWLEWIVNIRYHTGGQLTIGAIQRTVNAEYEFHS